ncbi:MAG: hypothetical protein Q4G40_09915, partial [Brachybacterium sp.]|nr:hypothetical protein [Brachybacterium sp.]
VREAARGIAEAAEALRDLGELLRHEAEEQESCSAADGPGRGGVMPGLPWGGRPIIGLPGGGLPLFGPPAEAGQDSAASGQSGWAEWLRDTGGIGRPLEVPPPLRERIWDRVG